MTALKAHSSRRPVIRCPYCTEGGNFKAMIGQGDTETRFMCPQCGHLDLLNDPTFKCICAKCATLLRGRKPTKTRR
jgi:DNA-directed RNA polymerase subunit RPC12/RpoP